VATFVLVHGAMHGGWCWRQVARLLTSQGHEVYSPTLSAQGDRRQALGPDIGVATHVTDLADLLWFEDLRDVHLVLHSYAGILAGPVADRAAGRLAAITFIGAFLAAPGESLLDVEPAEVARKYRELAASSGSKLLVPASAQFLDQWGISDQALRERVGPRLTDFPLRCLTDAVDFDPAALDRLPKTYIHHTNPPLASLRASFQRAVAGGWPRHELAYGHDMMLAAPVPTAELLAAIAECRPVTSIRGTSAGPEPGR
jgi:pimeloyl-ACP methyl ester carboxylesterase